MRPSQSPQLVLGLGIAVGLALPPLARRLRRILSPPPESEGRGGEGSAEAASAAGSARSVRSGLDTGVGGGAVRVPRPDLASLISGVLSGAGAGTRGAELAASVLAYADARGIPSHGANRADHYANELESGAVDGSAEPAVERRSGCCAVVDGKNGLGALASELAVRTAISLAREHGVGFVVCRNSNHFGAAGYWAQMALDANMMGMSFTNTSPIAVPTGGRARAVGTNPFCFFAPAEGGGDRDDFQLDMATTVVPIGKIEVLDRLGRPVPPGWGVDRNGRGCADAEEICRNGGLCPLGGAEETAGYKGYGLGMFVEILCSVLSGATVGPDVGPWLAKRGGPIDYGHCFVVIDPERFTPGYQERLGRYLRTMRALPGDVKVAGDPEKVFESDAKKNGILIHGPVAATLKSLAERYGVEVPPALAHLDATKSRGSLYAK